MVAPVSHARHPGLCLEVHHGGWGTEAWLVLRDAGSDTQCGSRFQDPHYMSQTCKTQPWTLPVVDAAMCCVIGCLMTGTQSVARQLLDSLYLNGLSMLRVLPDGMFLLPVMVHG